MNLFKRFIYYLIGVSFGSIVAYFIWKDPYMIVGSNTFIDGSFTEPEFTNISSLLSMSFQYSLIFI